MTAAVALGLVAAPQALAAPVFTLTGRGYGHGIGMSQYGAQGMASVGNDYRAILGRYYGGTSLTPAPLARIRVLLAVRGRVAVAAPRAAASLAVDGRPAGAIPEPVAPPPPPGTTPPPPQAPTAAPGGGTRTLAIAVERGRLVLRDERRRELASGTTMRLEASSPLVLGSAAYRGALVLTAGRGGVEVVNDLPLDDYVRGVVARESPSWWRPAALQAQAVAARTYALAVRKPSGSFDVYPDVRSQVYGGVAAETDSTDAAVAATAGQVLTYGGRIAATYFYSSSGGRTAALQDVWGGSPVDYLRSVPDPEDRISPYYTWRPAEFSARALGRSVGLRSVARVDLVVNPSRRVSTATFTAADGAARTYSGATVRTRLGLRSSWFRFRMVDLRTARRVGTRVTVTGRALPGGRATLLGRGADGTWRVLARGATTADDRVVLSGPAAGVTALRLRVVDAYSGVVRMPRPAPPDPPLAAARR